ncbi:MAG: transcriptional repressor NrdR [Candidatus Magasanikbacteria bacterium]|nr:transcriptional repressor NrdR [Candidatus Magasanikbacteria bacterium]
MNCPVCRSRETKVIDSRITQDGMSVRRRRECVKCSYRFSTVEQMEVLDITVVKNDGRREAYSRGKLQNGILQSLTKRPYTGEKFDRLMYAIERDLQKKKRREITSSEIGESVMKHLKHFDKVAYIRFASIYRAFEDVHTFENEIKSLKRGKKNHIEKNF